MTTVEQRNGFRLPWASEARPGAHADGDAAPADSSSTADDVTPESIEDPTIPEATEMQEATTIPDVRAQEPRDADPSAEADSTAPAPKRAPPRVRHDNPLVAGLIRAMRDAAGTARQEAAARFTEEAKARVESLNALSVEEAAQLRRQADVEIGEIRDWSKAEMARIREETDHRIAGRRRLLEGEVEAHAEHVERRIERVQAAIGDFGRRMDTFFEELLAEEDPARLATLAEQLPEPPALDVDAIDDLDDLDDREPTAMKVVLDARGAAAAEAEALADLQPADDDADPDAQPMAESDDDMPAEADVVRRLEAFTNPSVPTPEAVTSRLAVVGLVSVASIAGFKRALARTPGARSVTVTSGPTGDFVFTVVHDIDTDLPAAVAALDGFAAMVTGEADGVMTVTASDPGSAQ